MSQLACRQFMRYDYYPGGFASGALYDLSCVIMRVAFMIFMRAGGCLLARLDNQGSLATNHLWEIRSSTDLAVRAVRVKKSKIESARAKKIPTVLDRAGQRDFPRDFQHDKYSRAFLSSVAQRSIYFQPRARQARRSPNVPLTSPSVTTASHCAPQRGTRPFRASLRDAYRSDENA